MSCSQCIRCRFKDNLVPTLNEIHPNYGVIEPDDNYDNMRNTFVPWLPPTQIIFHTLQNCAPSLRGYRPVILLKRVHLPDKSASLNHLLRSMCNRLCFKVQRMLPCSFLGLDVQLRLPGEDVVEICLTALISYDPSTNSAVRGMLEHDFSSDFTSLVDFVPRNTALYNPSTKTNAELPLYRGSAALPFIEADESQSSASEQELLDPPTIKTGKPRPFAPSGVFITPLAKVNGYRAVKYCGLVVLHFIREGAQTLEMASINDYNHKFILEVMAVVKAHVRCIGGNALLSFRILPQETAEEDVEKAYSMITIAGDAALLEEERSLGVCLKQRDGTKRI